MTSNAPKDVPLRAWGQQQLLFLRRYEPDQVRGYESQHADAYTPEQAHCDAFADALIIVALNARLAAERSLLFSLMRLRWSNSAGWNGPCSSANCAICGALRVR